MSDKLVNLEDKIIAYLDGTLDETSRAELLHTLSVSPEKRKLLEEHIKLREIISLGHKPASVPLMTERKLAERIPVLMQELPYLADKSGRVAPIVPVSSTSYFTLLGRQVSSFFTSRFGQAVSLGTLALLGGMTWYMAQSNDSEQTATNAPTALQHEGPTLGPSTGANAPSTTTTSNSGSQGRTTNSSIIDPAAKDASLAQHSKRVASLSSSIRTTKNTKNTSKHSDVANMQEGTNSNMSDGLSLNDSQKQQEANNIESAPSLSDASKNADNTTLNENSDKANTNAKNADADKNIKDPNELPPLPLPSAERDVTGRFIGQVDYSGSFSVRPNVKAQQYETTSGIGSPVIGLGYEINSRWAIGIEAGKSSLFQQQQERIETPQYTSGPAGSQISVSDRVTYTTDVRDVDATWSQATLRYTIDPEATVRLELSGGAGAAFVNGVAPMVSVGSALTYDLTEALAITGGVTARGAWLSGRDAEVEPVATLGGGNAKAVVSERPATSDLFSSSIAARFGIRIGF